MRLNLQLSLEICGCAEVSEEGQSSLEPDGRLLFALVIGVCSAAGLSQASAWPITSVLKAFHPASYSSL